MCLKTRMKMVEKVNLQQHFCQHGINMTRKYLMKFVVNCHVMAALSNLEKDVYTVHQKMKKHQFISMDT